MDRDLGFFGGDDELRSKASQIIKSRLKINKFIPFGKGRPKRPEGVEGKISKDDKVNLVVALNTAKSMEEFLTMV